MEMTPTPIKQITNKGEDTIAHELENVLDKNSKLSIISAYFTIYAFSNLKRKLEHINQMRLGETDCRWWDLIMENLIKNDNKILIIFDYLPFFQDYLITFEKTDQVKLKLFAMYSNEIKPDLKSRLMSRQIYIIESHENLAEFNGKKMYEKEKNTVN